MNKFERLIASRPKSQKGANNEYLIRCPYHNDNKPSMGVNVAKGLFVCYACGEKGNAVKLTKKLVRGLKWKEAVEYYEPHDVNDVREEICLPEEYRSFFPMSELGREGRKACEYLIQQRKIPLDLIREFRLGYCATGLFAHRVIVPVYTRGMLKTFVARDYTGAAEKKVKYPVGSEPSGSLFGYDRAVVNNAQVIVVCEGWADALALWRTFSHSVIFQSWGAVALGTNRISIEQVMLLNKFKSFTIMLDNDAEGQKAIPQVASLLDTKPDTFITVAKLKSAKDPADASEREIEEAIGCAERYEVRR